MIPNKVDVLLTHSPGKFVNNTGVSLQLRHQPEYGSSELTEAIQDRDIKYWFVAMFILEITILNNIMIASGTETNINLDGIIIDGISAQIIVDNIIIQHDLRNPETDIKKVSIKTDDPGEAYPIGEIMLAAEAEGEDERYRTFFTNFGIPDPKYYDDIFIDSDINDDLPNYVSVNKNSKKLYLAYSEIFPYIGSYKALINAVKYLGYEDEIFFKEWYKEIGNSAMEDSGYTTFELSFGDNINKNTISNLELSERIHLRKMNWISMVYKINQEIDKSEDRFGFPTAITIYKNFNTERLVKLISLKKWLDKYAIGVNCHITDIGGEGLVFERYNLTEIRKFPEGYRI